MMNVPGDCLRLKKKSDISGTNILLMFVILLADNKTASNMHTNSGAFLVALVVVKFDSHSKVTSVYVKDQLEICLNQIKKLHRPGFKV